MSLDSARQESHYDSILTDYEAHYFDVTSMHYRHQFFYEWLLKGIDLDGANVADLACGSGQNSLLLRQRFPSCKTIGYDISSSACQAYTRNTGQPAVQIDLTRPARDLQQHDAAIIIGGIHHCIADLPATLGNVAAMLKPGGWLFMMEPNKSYVLEGLRRLWYRKDRYFDAESEEALDHDQLAKLGGDLFDVGEVRYLGGPAYFLILNSLLLRLPVRLKPYIAPPLFVAERLYNRALSTPYAFPVFIARWRRSRVAYDPVTAQSAITL
jgi:SAM-dependent methyltransferase